MPVTVVFPDELLVATREGVGDFTRNVQLCALGHMYAEGKISSGIAAKVLGCDRLEFYRLISERGFSVIDLPDDEREEEASTSRILAQQAREL